MAVDSGKALPPQHNNHKHKSQDFKGHKQYQPQPHQHIQQMQHKQKDMSKDFGIKSVREVTRKPMDITNKPRDSHQEIKYYPKKVDMSNMSHMSNMSSPSVRPHIPHSHQHIATGQIENHHHQMSSSYVETKNMIPMNPNMNTNVNVTEYTSNDIQVTSHKLEPIQLRPSSQQDSIQVTSHKVPSSTEDQIQDSPSQRLLRRKQTTTTKPPEVYLLDLDEVKVHKVKRIFKIGNKSSDDTPRRCHSEERANRRRTWHPTDTDRSTRSDGDVVTGRASRAVDDFSSPGSPGSPGSPLAQEDRASRPRQRRSAFMESIQSFFGSRGGSRKSAQSPLKHNGSSPPKSASPTSPISSVSPTRGSNRSDRSDRNDPEHHVARAVGGKYGGQQPKYDRVRHLAEENGDRSPQRPKSWEKSVITSPSSPLAEVSRSSILNKSSSLPPNQQPPGEEYDDKNHVIFGMGEKTFKRFSKYLTAYDDPPESRV